MASGICLITAGGAGMFCGSCMQDNTLVRSLRMAGAEALLIPTYTPIRVDEQNVSDARVFLGGINVYLDSRVPGWRLIPRSLRSWLDRPAVVSMLSRFSSSTTAADLGPLTVDMLRGPEGPQRAELDELCQFVVRDQRPEVLVLSNALISGVLPALRESGWTGRTVVLIQGDDIFLRDLPEPWQQRSVDLISRNCCDVDLFCSHSKWYADQMSEYLRLPRERFCGIPLQIEDCADDWLAARKSASAEVTIGYFARICPEKGAFRLLDAASRVLRRKDSLRFQIAGYLPGLHKAAFEKRLRKLQREFGDRVNWQGSPADRAQKFGCLSQFDWLCVPAPYAEPKGLYVLEAALAGVPSIVPAHGAFPERIAALGAGRLFAADSDAELDAALLAAEPRCTLPQMADLRARCLERFGMEVSGAEVLRAISVQPGQRSDAEHRGAPRTAGG